MHIVSSIEGRLRPELTAVDALRACFPAGTLSGAPKVRAMEIIEELEPARRGTYGGAVLYADFSGNLDSCIAIRSMLAIGGKGYVQAGAGIVADSVPELEYQESHQQGAGRDPRHRAGERRCSERLHRYSCSLFPALFTPRRRVAGRIARSCGRIRAFSCARGLRRGSCSGAALPASPRSWLWPSAPRDRRRCRHSVRRDASLTG